MIEFIFLILSVLYFLLIASFFVGIIIVKNQQPKSNHWKPLVSILVPARNEANTIPQTLKGLQQQTYDRIEIIIIDDHSTDDTSEVVARFIRENQLTHFKLLTHRTNGATQSYKKAAIAFGLQYASGEIIMTTDADCIVSPQWVESTVNQYDEKTGMVAGLITFHLEYEMNLFHKLQTLEFAGIVFAGIGAVGIGKPLICNGSNLSYRRQAFDEVDGFREHDHLPSGDDDLLMQNIQKKTDWKIKYNLERSSINYSHPAKSIPGFLNQRSRWASKGMHYPGLWISITLFLVYLFYTTLFILTPLTAIGWFPFQALLTGFLLKLIPEFLLIVQALVILDRKDLLSFFFLAELFQIPYVLIAGFRGFFNLFKWKNG